MAGGEGRGQVGLILRGEAKQESDDNGRPYFLGEFI